jgi:hypothetical protein
MAPIGAAFLGHERLTITRGYLLSQARRALPPSTPLIHSATTRRAIFMPTLVRFLAVIAVIGGLVFAAMFALATFVEPEPREITVTIPNSRLQPR